MKEFWDERYSRKDFAYGEQPNEYQKANLASFSAGTILFPADCEGRNSVFAAASGWTVSAFDQSFEVKNKALLLARHNQVTGTDLELYILIAVN